MTSVDKAWRSGHSVTIYVHALGIPPRSDRTPDHPAVVALTAFGSAIQQSNLALAGTISVDGKSYTFTVHPDILLPSSKEADLKRIYAENVGRTLAFQNGDTEDLAEAAGDGVDVLGAVGDFFGAIGRGVGRLFPDELF